MLLVDAGNFASDHEHWEKAEFIWDLMARLGYDAVTPGDLEMREGADSLLALYARHPEISVVSANLLGKDGKLLFPTYAIIKKGNLKIGVTGVAEETLYNKAVADSTQKIDDFAFKDSEKALRSVVAELRKKADVVVALLQWSDLAARTRLKEIEGIDVAVTGQRPAVAAESVGNTALVIPGFRGRYMGVVDVALDENKAITEHTPEVRKVGEDVRLDSEYEFAILEWSKKFADREGRRKLMRKLEEQKREEERQAAGADPDEVKPTTP